MLADGRLQLSTKDQLRLYGLLQVATVGRCSAKRPIQLYGDDFNRWLAWHEMGEMSQSKAKVFHSRVFFHSRRCRKARRRSGRARE